MGGADAVTRELRIQRRGIGERSIQIRETADADTVKLGWDSVQEAQKGSPERTLAAQDRAPRERVRRAREWVASVQIRVEHDEFYGHGSARCDR